MCSVRFTKCLFFSRNTTTSFTIDFNLNLMLMNYKRSTLQRCLAAFLSLFSLTGLAQFTPALVDFEAYEKLVAEVKQHRQSRLLNAEEFVKAGKQKKVIILDTRSDAMYAAVHVKGAIHLNFSDFTQANLQKIIPSPDYKILIYCNNNFISRPVKSPEPVIESKDYTSYFMTKSVSIVEKVQPTAITYALMKSSDQYKQSAQLRYPPEQTKPLTLALNIPTYINLYGYSYRNVYELSELVNTYDSPLEFEGTAVK